MQYDVIIIGGGMVGATLASAFKNTKLKIALVDAAPYTDNEDRRLIALNDASVCLFENIGIWPLMAPYASAIKQVHVSHSGRFGMARIHASDINVNALGYVVPAKYINHALGVYLKNASNIEIFKPVTLETLTQHSSHVTVTLSNQHHYQAKYLVGADGNHSTVRTLLNIPTETTDYQQTALVTETILQRDHGGIAYERFLQEGAIAMLPLVGEKAATIWTAATDTINELMQLSDKEFLSALQKQFGYRLGKLVGIEKRATYPLKMIRAEKQRQDNCWLIGNAAHAMHPIAAQGLNLALYEIAIFASALLENNTALLDQLDKQKFSLSLSHKLTWLFSSDMFGFNQMRQLGLIGLDVFSGLKKRFATHAIGRGSFIPSLLTRNVE